MIESMLSQELGPSPHSDSIVATLSFLLLDLTGCVWRILHDVPLYQLSQSTAIDEALFQHLLLTAPSTRSQAHLSALHHAGDWLNGVPSTTLEWVFTFRTRSFAFSYTLLAWSASTLLLLLPWMPQYSWSFWWLPGWLWGQWRQDHQAQCRSRCYLFEMLSCYLVRDVCHSRCYIAQSAALT